MKNRLSTWVGLAEVVSAVAVVVSLAYLGMQVNDSAKAIRSAATNDAATAMQAWYLEVGSNSETAALFFTGMTQPETLSRVDFFQFVMITHAAMLALQNSFLLAKQGSLDLEL